LMTLAAMSVSTTATYAVDVMLGVRDIRCSEWECPPMDNLDQSCWECQDQERNIDKNVSGITIIPVQKADE
jgi:hypothetical protein